MQFARTSLWNPKGVQGKRFDGLHPPGAFTGNQASCLTRCLFILQRVQVVDERLWNDEDDGKDKDKDKNKDKSEKYEKNAPIQVEDKTDLEYAAGQEEEQQDGPGKEPPKKEQGKDKKKDEPVGAVPWGTERNRSAAGVPACG